MTQLKVGIIGAGGIARGRHIPSVSYSANYANLRKLSVQLLASIILIRGYTSKRTIK
jgi:predicted dehydrogenase